MVSFLYSIHISLLAIKLGLTTSWQVNNVDIKEQIEAIWYNKTIDELDTQFTCHPEWWLNTIIIYAKL